MLPAFFLFAEPGLATGQEQRANEAHEHKRAEPERPDHEKK